jgi:hypothetical protein
MTSDSQITSDCHCQDVVFVYLILINKQEDEGGKERGKERGKRKRGKENNRKMNLY